MASFIASDLFLRFYCRSTDAGSLVGISASRDLFAPCFFSVSNYILITGEKNLRFNVRVGEAVGVHGSEVSAADDAHHQATLLRAVLQRDHDAPAFLQRLIVRLIDLKGECATMKDLQTVGSTASRLTDVAAASVVLCVKEK